MGEPGEVRARPKLTVHVDCGDGAVMEIVDPNSFSDGGVEWRLRYGNPDEVRFIAAGVVASYDYLCSAEITMGEAVRRLRLLRRARMLATQSKAPSPTAGGLGAETEGKDRP